MTVYFDADGTLVDSQAVAIEAANQLLRLLEPDAAPIVDRASLLRRFDRLELNRRFGAAAAVALRSLHPAVTARLVHSRSVPLFEPAIVVAAGLTPRPSIITASYASTIAHLLGPATAIFESIVGREEGRKVELLGALAVADPEAVYVTDTATDVRRCHAVGLAVVGVAWGYDGCGRLEAAGCVEIVDTADELRAVLGAKHGRAR